MSGFFHIAEKLNQPVPRLALIKGRFWSRDWRELVVAVCFLGIAVFVCVTALGYGLFRHGENGFGPGVLPLGVGGVLGLFALAVGARSVAAIKRSGPRQVAGDSEAMRAHISPGHHTNESSVSQVKSAPQGQSLLKPWLILGAVGLTVASVQLVGQSVASGLLIFMLLALVERQKVVTALVAAIATSVFVWRVFGVFFGLPIDFGVL